MNKVKLTLSRLAALIAVTSVGLAGDCDGSAEEKGDTLADFKGKVEEVKAENDPEKLKKLFLDEVNIELPLVVKAEGNVKQILDKLDTDKKKEDWIKTEFGANFGKLSTAKPLTELLVAAGITEAKFAKIFKKDKTVDTALLIAELNRGHAGSSDLEKKLVKAFAAAAALTHAEIYKVAEIKALFEYLALADKSTKDEAATIAIFTAAITKIETMLADHAAAIKAHEAAIKAHEDEMLKNAFGAAVWDKFDGFTGANAAAVRTNLLTIAKSILNGTKMFVSATAAAVLHNNTTAGNAVRVAISTKAAVTDCTGYSLPVGSFIAYRDSSIAANPYMLYTIDSHNLNMTAHAVVSWGTVGACSTARDALKKVDLATNIVGSGTAVKLHTT